MMNIFDRFKNLRFFWLGLIIHLLFYISMWHSSHFLNIFFPIGQLHNNYIGLDFYQIPAGAYNFFHNDGTLEGRGISDPNGFAEGRTRNTNVYHPLLTLILGGALQFPSPLTSILIWQIFKLLLTGFMVFFLLSRFSKSKNLDIALFFYLVYFAQYHELKIAQYQFLLNNSLLIFLIYLNTTKNRASIFLIFSLLVKPVAIMWYPILVIRKYKYLAIKSLTVFILMTLPFYFSEVSKYYFDNLAIYLTSSYVVDDTDIYTISSILKKIFGEALILIKYIKYFFLLLIISLAFIRRVSSATIFLGMTVSYLLFGFRVYEYHYSILIPFIVHGILCEKKWDKLPIKIIAALCAAPSVFVIFYMFDIGVVNHKIQEFSWYFVNLSRTIPAFILFIAVVVYSLINNENANETNNNSVDLDNGSIESITQSKIIIIEAENSPMYLEVSYWPFFLGNADKFIMMRIGLFLFILFFSLDILALGRSPAIPKISRENLPEKICSYRKLIKENTIDSNIIDFVSILENMFNSNQLEADIKLKTAVFCLLIDYYKIDSPEFAKDFSEQIPDAKCN